MVTAFLAFVGVDQSKIQILDFVPTGETIKMIDFTSESITLTFRQLKFKRLNFDSHYNY
jgi:hypothetical protein